MKSEDLARRLQRAAKAKRADRWRRAVRRPVRTLLPKLLERTGHQVERRAELFWGGAMDVVLPEMVSTEIWRYGLFEEDVTAFLLNHLSPEAVCIDVGAHFGYFTLLASRLVGPGGRVIALEPMPSTFERLERNVRKHAPYPNVGLCNAAAYDGETELVFNDFGIVGSAFNSFFAARRGLRETVPPRRVPVRARRISQIVGDEGLHTITLLKIDAESAEGHVLAGAEDALVRHRPAVVLEVGDQDVAGAAPSATLVDWMRDRGFAPFEYRSGAIVAHEPRRRYGYGNLLFRPLG